MSNDNGEVKRGRGRPKGSKNKESSDNNNDDEVWQCSLCNKDLNTHPYHIGCDGSCHRWFHKSCLGMSDDEYKYLDDHESSN